MPETNGTRRCSRIDPETGHSCENEATEKHAWCNPCKAKYQKEYTALLPGMAHTRGYLKGVETLRCALVQEFDRLGGGMFSGDECAALIQQFPAPRSES